jgi:hypothetical protein
LLWGLMKGIEVVGHGVSPDTTFIALGADTSKAKIDCRSAVVWAKFAVRRQPPAIPTKFSRLPQKVPLGHRIDDVGWLGGWGRACVGCVVRVEQSPETKARLNTRGG